MITNQIYYRERYRQMKKAGQIRPKPGSFRTKKLIARRRAPIEGGQEAVAVSPAAASAVCNLTVQDQTYKPAVVIPAPEQLSPKPVEPVEEQTTPVEPTSAMEKPAAPEPEKTTDQPSAFMDMLAQSADPKAEEQENAV